MSPKLRLGAVALLALGVTSSANAANAPRPSGPATTSAAKITELSPEQRAALRAELARYLRQDSDGLVSRFHTDGSVSIDLEGRYAHAMVVRPASNGRPELACFEDPDAAVHFLARDDIRARVENPGKVAPSPEERDR